MEKKEPLPGTERGSDLPGQRKDDHLRQEFPGNDDRKNKENPPAPKRDTPENDQADEEPVEEKSEKI